MSVAQGCISLEDDMGGDPMRVSTVVEGETEGGIELRTEQVECGVEGRGRRHRDPVYRVESRSG